MVANDTGHLTTLNLANFPVTNVEECNYLNNLDSIVFTGCIEICDNGIDDDGDGYIDEFDSDCPCNILAYHNQCIPDCQYEFMPDTFAMKRTLGMDTVFDFQSVFVGDVDNDGRTEVVALSNHVLSTSPVDWCPSSHFSKDIYIFDAQTGVKKYVITTPYIAGFAPNQFAIADIDLDGNAEIIIETAGQTVNNSICGGSTSLALNSVSDASRLICYKLNGTEVWRTAGNIGVNITNSAPYPAGATTIRFGSTVGLADFNEDGTPEVYVFNEIYNAQTGVLLAQGGANGIGYNNEINFPGSYEGINATQSAGDLIPSDPGVELLAGKTVYTVNITNTTGTSGNTMTAINAPGGRADGLTAIADIDLDGQLDVITSASNSTSKTYIWNPRTGTIIAERTTYSQPQANGPYYGQPFVGDVDGDGIDEIGYGQNNYMVLFDYVPGNTTLQYKYHVLSQDASSQRTCMSMFDFNQDGAMEIIYRDERKLMIIEGNSGVVLTSYTCNSGTGYEYPTVADIDNDGQAELICTCILHDSITLNPSISQVQIFEAANRPWAPARKVWNQFGYHATNINDDLTVPISIQNHALVGDSSRRLNFYIAQSSLYDSSGNYIFPAADAIGTFNIAPEDICNDDTLNLIITITNNGDAPLESGVPVAFYNQNPTLAGALPYTILPLGYQPLTDTTLLPGQSDTLLVKLLKNVTFTKLFMSVNANQNSTLPLMYPSSAIAECNYLNNLDSLDISGCPEICGNGIDDDGDGLIDCADTTDCKPYAGIDKITCINDSIQMSATGSGIWSLGAGSAGTATIVNTTDSISFIKNFSTAGTYYMVWSNGSCSDTALITVLPISTFTQDTTVCFGASVTVCGNTHSATGTYTDTCVAANGCDSIVTTNLTVLTLPVIDTIIAVCVGTDGFADITVNATVASGTLEYSIDGGAYQAGNTFSSVANGAHTFNVRIVSYNCETGTNYTLTCPVCSLQPGTIFRK